MSTQTKSRSNGKASTTQAPETKSFDIAGVLALGQKHAPKMAPTAKSNDEFEQINAEFPMVRGKFWDAKRPRLSGEEYVEAKRLGLDIPTGRSRYPRAGAVLAKMSSAVEHNRLMQFPSIYVSVPAFDESGAPNEAGIIKIGEYYDRLQKAALGYKDEDGKPIKNPFEFTEVGIERQVRDDNGLVRDPETGAIVMKQAFGTHPDIRDNDGNMKTVLLYGFYVKSRRKSETAHNAEVRFMEADV